MVVNKMKIFSYVLAVMWSVLFIALFFGYEPSKIFIGTAFLVVILHLLSIPKSN